MDLETQKQGSQTADSSIMQDWQKEAIETLLSDDFKSSGKVQYLGEGRLYLDSTYTGASTYHVITYTAGQDIIIDQIDSNEKYQQRVYIEEQEVKPLLRALLRWYLGDVERETQAQYSRSLEPVVEEEDPDSLDDHPF